MIYWTLDFFFRFLAIFYYKKKGYRRSIGVKKMELEVRCPGVQNMHFFLPGTFCEKMKSAWKGVEVKDTFLPGTFCEKKKSALKGAEVKDTFLPGTFSEKM